MDLQFSNPTIVHALCTGATFMIMHWIAHVLGEAGIIVIDQVIVDIGIWLFWVGLAIVAVFGVIFFLENDVV